MMVARPCSGFQTPIMIFASPDDVHSMLAPLLDLLHSSEFFFKTLLLATVLVPAADE
jgi:hypothetical protein